MSNNLGPKDTTKKLLRVKRLLLHSELLALDACPHLFQLFCCFLYINKASLHFLGQSADSILPVTGYLGRENVFFMGMRAGLNLWYVTGRNKDVTAKSMQLQKHKPCYFANTAQF